MTLDRHADRLLRMLASAAPDDDAGPPSPGARRESLRRLAALAGDPSGPDVIADEITCSASVPVTVRRYRPQGSGEARGLIVYLHGGGWVAGDLDTHDGVCRALCRESGFVVLAADYRRPPEHRFPTAIDDAVALLAWARREARGLGAHPGKLVLAGDSAGANVATAACGLLIARGEPVADLLLLLCPILDVRPIRPSRRLFAEGYFLDQGQMRQDLADYLPEAVRLDDPRISPLCIPHLSGFPATQIHVAEYDPFRDEGLDFGDRLKGAGIPVQVSTHAGMIHYFYALPRAIPYARTALAEIGAAVRAALA